MTQSYSNEDVVEVLSKNYISDNHDANELIKRLKKVSLILADIEQLSEENDARNSMKAISKDLLNNKITKHQNKEVRLLNACCLSDILRILAPTTFYSNFELKVIFECFAAQIQKLVKAEREHIEKLYYLIENIANVKSVVLLLNIEAYDVVCALINTIFYVINNYKDSDKIQNWFYEIIVTCIEETLEITEDLVYALIVNVVNKRVTPKGYSFCCIIIKKCLDLLISPINQFVTAVFTVKTDTMDELSDETYNLVYELFKINPELVNNTLRIMGDELNSPVLDRRMRSCNLVGRMSSKRDSIVLKEHLPLLNEYFARFMDKRMEVRVVAIETSCKIIKNLDYNNPIYDSLVENLAQSALDIEPKVRESFVKYLCERILKNNIIRKIPSPLFKELLSKLKDKNREVRTVCMSYMGRIWSDYLLSYCNVNLYENISEKFYGMPFEILYSLNHLPNPDEKTSCESILNKQILGFEFNEEKSHPSSYSKKSNSKGNVYDKVSYQRVYNLLGLFYMACTYDYSQAYPMINNFITNKFLHLSKFKYIIENVLKPDEINQVYFNECVQTLSDLYFGNNFNLIHFISKLNPSSNNDNELLMKIHELVNMSENFNKNFSYEEYVALLESTADNLEIEIANKCATPKENIVNILLRLSNPLFNKDFVRICVEFLDSSTCFVNLKLRLFTLWFLEALCKEQPKYLLACHSRLLKQLSSQNEQVCNYTLRLLSTLKLNQDKEAFRPHEDTLNKFVLEGTGTQAKHSLRILFAVTVNKNLLVSNLLENIVGNLTFSNPHLIIHLKALTHLIRENYECLANIKNKIISFVMDEVIISADHYNQDFNQITPQETEWFSINYNKHDKIKLKKAGIKLLKEFLLQQPVDYEKKYLYQAYIIIKLILECCSTKDAIYSDDEYLEVRKYYVLNVVHILGNKKYRNYVQGSYLGYFALFLIDKYEPFRTYVFDVLCKGLFGMLKAGELQLVLSPVFYPILCYYEAYNSSAKTTLKGVVNRYTKGLRSGIKAQFACENFIQYLWYTFFRIPNLIKDKNTELIRITFNKFVEYVCYENEKPKIDRISALFKILEDLKLFYINTKQEECTFEKSKNYNELELNYDFALYRNFKNVFKEDPKTLYDLQNDLAEYLKDQMTKNHVKNAKLQDTYKFDNSLVNPSLFYKVTKDIKKTDRDIIKNYVEPNPIQKQKFTLEDPMDSKMQNLDISGNSKQNKNEKYSNGNTNGDIKAKDHDKEMKKQESAGHIAFEKRNKSESKENNVYKRQAIKRGGAKENLEEESKLKRKREEKEDNYLDVDEDEEMDDQIINSFVKNEVNNDEDDFLVF